MTARVDRKEQAVATRLRRRAPVIGWMLAGLLVGPGAAVWAPSAAAADATDGAYVWNEMQGEKLVALGTKGDAARGEITFEICQGCHRAHALGRPDGSYPRLAGQHITVLIKQMTDVRAGRRKNEKMLPFIDKHVTSPQDIADVAAYLTQLPSPPGNGQGPGTDLARGEGIYAAQCASCHGAGGEGDAPKFYPRLSGQHYKYMLREMVDIREGTRANSNPRMVEVVKPLTMSDLEATADYISRMSVVRAKP
jgi:cytochrome c553